MIPANKEYPVFEANQVLTATHLNTLEKYLDEQNRLTRAALHGIGIVCGLEVSIDDTRTILTISKGYGITSEGYPGIVGNEDFVASRYQEFTVPDNYPIFSKDHKNNYSLQELLDAGHDDYNTGTPLTKEILEKKVVLLFVEILEKDLKNCSATSCDDLGLKVQIKTRMLLVSETELAAMNAEIAENTAKEKAKGDFFPNLTARLGLPDIHLPRLDVPASNMVDGPSIFDAYRSILSAPRMFSLKTRPLFNRAAEGLKKDTLFTAIGKALDDCHEAFKPLLPDRGRINISKSATFAGKLEEIEKIYTDNLTGNANVIYSQYFYDFLGDLIEAYDEFRWKAVEFLALCNPPQTLFPRHLELGETGSGNFAGRKVHRHYFRPSPALSEGKKSGEEVQQLFLRLQLLVDQFKAPSLPVKGTIDAALKITPSRLGNIALSDKAIPCYYSLSDELQRAWNFTKTSRGRADQTLGYNATGSADALMFDLDHYNFYRIEGHIGFDWRDTVKNLLDKIRKYRLPFDVVALNAYPVTATAPVLADPLIAHCITDDLEIIYDAWSQELACLMREQIGKLTNFKLAKVKASATPGIEKTLLSPKIKAAAAKAAFRKVDLSSSIVTESDTFGKIYANTLKVKAETPSADLKQTFNTLLLKEKQELGKISIQEYNTVIGNRLDMVTSMMDFADDLPTRASEMNYASISKKYKKLQDAAAKYREDISRYDTSQESAILSEAQKQETLNDLDELLRNCLMERLEALNEELEQRKKEVDELIFFSKYVQKHPGISHKAGVPAGGTFILLFQETPTGSGAFPDKKAGKYTIPERVVIADFFLPYRCCSDCPPVQFVMPAARPKFTMQQKCPGNDGFAWVNLDFTYRVPPCEVKIDNLNYVPLVDDRISLKVGAHLVTVMDAEGGVSLGQSIQVLPRFTVTTGEPVFDAASKTCTTKLTITDAQLPITIDGEEATATIQATNIHTVSVTYDKTRTINVGDASPCPAQEVKLCIPVIFTMTQECADNQGDAAVIFEFTCGEAPFEVKIGNKEYVPLVDNRMQFKVGTYQFIVRDANGCVSAVQSIVIVPRFTVQAEKPVCDEANENYTVKLLVSNAHLPITIDGNKVDSIAESAIIQSVIVGPYKSGESVKLTIGDGSNCAPEILTLSHSCCDLPCNGIALRRGYRFPLPEPSSQLTMTLDFWIEYPAGERISLSDEVKEIVLKGNDVANQINALIDKKTGIPGWISLHKDRSSEMIPEVPAWSIEYLECLELKFGFNLKWSYRVTGRLANTVEVSIDPVSSVIKINSADKPVTLAEIPAFDGFRTDKCHPANPEKPLCKEPDLKLLTSAKVEGNTVILVSETSGNDKAVAFLWEVPESVQKMANGDKATFTFSSTDNTEKPYRVTAFTERGCRVIKDGSFKFNILR